MKLLLRISLQMILDGISIIEKKEVANQLICNLLRRERIMNLTLVTSYKSSSCLYQIRFQ